MNFPPVNYLTLPRTGNRYKYKTSEIPLANSASVLKRNVYDVQITGDKKRLRKLSENNSCKHISTGVILDFQNFPNKNRCCLVGMPGSLR